MQSQSKIFDDIAKVVSGAAGTVAGIAREAEAGARERAREWVGGLDLISREEFEVQKDLLAAAQAEIAALEARLAAIEASRDIKAPRKPKA
jgi:BMFP domain-containing protein YqiC